MFTYVHIYYLAAFFVLCGDLLIETRLHSVSGVLFSENMYQNIRALSNVYSLCVNTTTFSHHLVSSCLFVG